MSELIPHRPQVFRSAFGLGRDFERALDQLFHDSWRGSDVSGAWAPPIDVRHTDEAIDVWMDIPGMSNEELDIRIEGNTLTISGERKDTSSDNGNVPYLTERVFGRFERTFALPMELESTKADATYRGGVLHISIPRAEQAKPRRLQIKAG